MSLPSQSFTANGLLSLMPAADFRLLAPYLKRVDLTVGEELVRAHEPIEHVDFLEGGVGSVVAPQDDGEIEVGVFGREGISGTAVLLGADQTPHKSFMQVDGTTSLRISVEDLRSALRKSETLQMLLLRYVQTFTLQAAQTAAANAHYDLPERLARWLLMCHARLDGDEIKLTHDFMSMMLGVRRSGVTVTLHTLEGSGAIRSTRGLVTVIARERLEEIAGDSYGMAESEYRRLIGNFGKSAGPRGPPLELVR